MRISSNRSYEYSLAALNAASERLDRANRTVSSGKQLNQPSDDPGGLTQALDLQNSLDNFDQFTRNVDDARGFIGTSDNALSDASNLLRQARTLAIQAVNGTLDDTGRTGIANQISSIIQRLSATANTTHGSRYVFGGQRTTQPPFVADNGVYTYQGGTSGSGDAQLTVEIGRNETMVTNETGDNLFGAAFDSLTKIRDHVMMDQGSAISKEDLSALDAATQTITIARTVFGGKVQSLDQATLRFQRMKTDYAGYLSKIQDADLTKATLDLRTAETSYQAALTAAAHGFQQTLLDFLK